MTPPPPNLPPLEKLPDWQLVAEALRILGNVPPGYGADLSLAIVAEAARRKLIERMRMME